MLSGKEVGQAAQSYKVGTLAYIDTDDLVLSDGLSVKVRGGRRFQASQRPSEAMVCYVLRLNCCLSLNGKGFP